MENNGVIREKKGSKVVKIRVQRGGARKKIGGGNRRKREDRETINPNGVVM